MKSISHLRDFRGGTTAGFVTNLLHCEGSAVYTTLAFAGTTKFSCIHSIGKKLAFSASLGARLICFCITRSRRSSRVPIDRMGRSMALLTMEQCKDVMADCMADDVGLRWPEMQSWSLEEVEAYFLSGGITIPAVVQHTYIDDRQSRTEAYREAYPVAEENANPLWCCGGQWQQYAAQLNPVPAAHADGAPPKMGGVPMDRRAVSMDTPPHKVGGISMDRRAISMDALSTHADKQPVAMFASTSTAATKRRPRLLCCHGSNSNAEATRYQAILLGLDDLEPADAPCHCIFLVRACCPARQSRPTACHLSRLRSLRFSLRSCPLTPATRCRFALTTTGRAVQGRQV